MPQKIYHFHAQTFEFLGEGLADPSPKEPDVWLDPAHSTRTPPPDRPEGYAAIFKSGSWSLVADHRDETWWKDGEEKTIDFLGDPIDFGFVQSAPEVTPPQSGEPNPQANEEQLVRDEAQRRLVLISTPYQEGERETWFTQVNEARNYQSNPNSSTPFLSVRAAARGLTIEEMVELVLLKADTYAAAAAKVLACQDKLLSLEVLPSDFRDEEYWQFPLE